MSKKIVNSKKDNNEQSKSTAVPVFRLKPLSNERVSCKYVGCVENSDKLIDETIEFDEIDKVSGSNTMIGLGKYGEYLVYGKALICNISGAYLLKNKKLPVYYMTTLYNRQFISGGLFSIFLYFTLDTSTLETLTTPQKYVNRLLTGSFTLELVADDGFLGNFIENRTPLLEQEIMEKYVNEFKDANDEEQSKLMEKITYEVNNKLDQYRELFKPESVSITNLRAVITKMKELIKSDIYKDLIVEGLNCRDRERKEKNCPDLDFKKPNTKKIINLKELKENPDKIDEIINRLSEVDSDED
jgi:hypothetical protein